MKYLDGFSGYGGFHLGLERAGFHFDEVYYSEINKYAIANYSYNFPNSIYAGSIDTICESGIITELDLFTFGWPCQDNSIAGKRKGQTAGTRSGLLYEAVKIINKFKPRNFIAENVAGLLSVNAGVDIIESLRVLAYLNESCPQYDIEMQLLNTRWVLPQNRERLYFVGHLRGSGSRQIFPIGEELQLPGQERMDTTPCISALTATDYKGPSKQRPNLVVPVASATKSGYELASEGDSINFSVPNSKTRRVRVGKGVAQTLDTQCNQGIIQLNPSLESGGKQPYQQNRVYDKSGISPALNSQLSDMYKTNDAIGIRRLTPVECERLQGLPDGWTATGIINNSFVNISDSQRYRLVGNGVTADIVEMIGKKLIQSI